MIYNASDLKTVSSLFAFSQRHHQIVLNGGMIGSEYASSLRHTVCRGLRQARAYCHTSALDASQ